VLWCISRLCRAAWKTGAFCSLLSSLHIGSVLFSEAWETNGLANKAFPATKMSAGIGCSTCITEAGAARPVGVAFSCGLP